MLLPQSERRRHAKEMIAMDEIDSRPTQERLGNRRALRRLHEDRGEISMQPKLCRAQKIRLQDARHSHSREKSGVGVEIGAGFKIGPMLARPWRSPRRVGHRQAQDLRAKAAIGARLRRENLMAAAGMPGRMDQQDRLAKKWRMLRRKRAARGAAGNLSRCAKWDAARVVLIHMLHQCTSRRMQKPSHLGAPAKIPSPERLTGRNPTAATSLRGPRKIPSPRLGPAAPPPLISLRNGPSASPSASCNALAAV